MANGVSTSKASPTNKHSENRAHKRGFSVSWGLVTFSHAVRRVFIFHTQTHVCVFTRALWRVFIRLPTSHTPQGVFSSFMHKRTFVFSLAPSGAFSFVLAPRGAAACSIQNPHQRVTASSPGCSRLGGETLGKSNKLILNPELSEWVAEAEPSRFPMNGGAGFPWLSGKRNPARAGQDESPGVFSSFAHLSHAARRVFTFHTQTHVCVFTRALWRVFIRSCPTRRSRVLYSEPAPAGDSQ